MAKGDGGGNNFSGMANRMRQNMQQQQPQQNPDQSLHTNMGQAIGQMGGMMGMKQPMPQDQQMPAQSMFQKMRNPSMFGGIGQAMSGMVNQGPVDKSGMNVGPNWEINKQQMEGGERPEGYGQSNGPSYDDAVKRGEGGFGRGMGWGRGGRFGGMGGMGGGAQTMGGPANDPRWFNGTWGSDPARMAENESRMAQSPFGQQLGMSGGMGNRGFSGGMFGPSMGGRFGRGMFGF